MAHMNRQGSYGKYANHLTDELDTLLEDIQILRQEAQKLLEHKRLYEERVERYTATEELKRLTDTDREDLQAKGRRAKELLENIYINVSPVRAPEQLRDFQRATAKFVELRDQLHKANASGDLETVSETARRIHEHANACSPEATGALDYKYQSVVLGCTKDDQKELRRQWASLSSEADAAVSRVTYLAASAPPPQKSHASVTPSNDNVPIAPTQHASQMPYNASSPADNMDSSTSEETSDEESPPVYTAHNNALEPDRNQFVQPSRRPQTAHPVQQNMSRPEYMFNNGTRGRRPRQNRQRQALPHQQQEDAEFDERFQPQRGYRSRQPQPQQYRRRPVQRGFPGFPNFGQFDAFGSNIFDF